MYAVEDYHKKSRTSRNRVRTRFNITDLGPFLKKHLLGVWYEWNQDEEGIYLKAEMDKMIKTMVRTWKK
jgi:hypothetical protein